VATDPAYCSTCGTELSDKKIEGRMRRHCHSCEKPIYRNPKPCAGVLVVDDQERVLLVKRTNPPAVGSWSLPAGYLEADEPPQEAAVRELHEETGLTVLRSEIKLFDTEFVHHPNGEHIIVVIYTTTRASTTGSLTSGSDAGAARFWDLTKLATSDQYIEPGYDAVFEDAVNFTSNTVSEKP